MWGTTGGPGERPVGAARQVRRQRARTVRTQGPWRCGTAQGAARGRVRLACRTPAAASVESSRGWERGRGRARPPGGPMAQGAQGGVQAPQPAARGRWRSHRPARRGRRSHWRVHRAPRTMLHGLRNRRGGCRRSGFAVCPDPLRAARGADLYPALGRAAALQNVRENRRERSQQDCATGDPGQEQNPRAAKLHGRCRSGGTQYGRTRHRTYSQTALFFCRGRHCGCRAPATGPTGGQAARRLGGRARFKVFFPAWE